MERLDSKMHQKFTALKKRKLLDEGLEQKRKLCNAFKDCLHNLEKDLIEKLLEKQDELEKARQESLEDIRRRDSEIQMLKRLLDVKAEKSNSKTKTPLSHGKVKRVQLSENDPHSNPTKGSQELECSTRHAYISGNRTNKIPSAHILCSDRTNKIPSAHILCSVLQSLVRMKISVHDETEIFSISVSHEASGYSFTLTWLEESDEWSYKLFSLGTLERIAAEWMRQDIRFSMKMLRMFFERIENIITYG